MDTSSCIYWFSGTGNSLYAAKRLSAELEELPLVKMSDGVPYGTVGGKNVKIGFVFPSYFGNLPRAVRAFIEKLEIEPETYLFAVVTMGAVGQGSLAALNSALKAKGCKLNYGRGIRMPANYVIKYNPADSDKSVSKIDKTDKRLSKFAAEIKMKTQSVKKLPMTFNTLYKNIESLDDAFIVTENCTSCGLCEKICPVNNIRLVNDTPEWLHRCEHCVACISWCPAQAIEYGNRTQSRRRYCNSQIQVAELMRQN